MYAQAWHWIGMSSTGSISLLTWGLLSASGCSLEACSRTLGLLLLLENTVNFIYLFFIQVRSSITTTNYIVPRTKYAFVGWGKSAHYITLSAPNKMSTIITKIIVVKFLQHEGVLKNICIIREYTRYENTGFHWPISISLKWENSRQHH